MASFEQKVNFFLRYYFSQEKFGKNGVKVKRGYFGKSDARFFIENVMKNNSTYEKEIKKMLLSWENKDCIPFESIKKFEIFFNGELCYVTTNNNNLNIRNFIFIKNHIDKIYKTFNGQPLIGNYRFDENKIVLRISHLFPHLIPQLNAAVKRSDV